jgi:glycine cleavage system transcriptional repressor
MRTCTHSPISRQIPRFAVHIRIRFFAFIRLHAYGERPGHHFLLGFVSRASSSAERSPFCPGAQLSLADPAGSCENIGARVWMPAWRTRLVLHRLTFEGNRRMKKAIVTVLGFDRPGIVAAVSKALFDFRCNIEDVSQTILQTEFAGIFIASMPDRMSLIELLAGLEDRLNPQGLAVYVKELQLIESQPPPETEPFVITTVGPDRLGLVAGITGLLAEYRINITQLRAVFRGGEDPRRNVMIYEVDIPIATDHPVFRAALYARGKELGLEVSLQHRDIFEQIHRI